MKFVATAGHDPQHARRSAERDPVAHRSRDRRGTSSRKLGVLVQIPGYDPDSQLFYRPYDPTVPITVPTHPTSDDLAQARTLIDELSMDFPFASNADRTNHIGTMALPFVRHYVHGPTPLHLYEAPGPGTGKTS